MRQTDKQTDGHLIVVKFFQLYKINIGEFSFLPTTRLHLLYFTGKRGLAKV
jgi:hypothetical protein